MGFGGPPMMMRRGPGGPGGAGMGGPPGAGGSSRPSLRTAFVSLKNPNYRALWLSQLASFTGMQMQMVARGWLAFQLTGSFTSVGIVMMAWGIPMLLFSLHGGAVADRMNKRNLVLVSQMGTGVLALITALMITFGVISIPILFVMGLFQGTLFAFNMPARQALLAELVSPRELMNAIALNMVAMNGTRIIAPAIAGVLIATWGVDAAYYAQTAMYGFVLLFMLRLPSSTSHLANTEHRGNINREIGRGLSYIFNSRTLLGLMVMAFVPTILGMPYMTLLPGFAVDDLGLDPGGFGFMFTITGVGAIVGSIVIASMTEFPRKALLQAVIGFGYGGALLLLGVASIAFGYAGALVGLALLGLFSTTYMTLNNTMIMTATKPEYYGRVMSVYMLTFSLFPLMSGPLGVVADAISAKTTFVGLGTAIIAFMIIAVIANPRYILRRTPLPEFGPPDGAMPGAATMGRPGIAPDAGAGSSDGRPAVPSMPDPTSDAGAAPLPAMALADSNGDGAAAVRAIPPRRIDYMRGHLSPATNYMDSATNGDAAAAAAGNGAGGARQPVSPSNGANGAGRSRAAAYGLVAPSRDGDAPRTYGLAAVALDGVPSNGAVQPPAAEYGLEAPSRSGDAPRTYGLGTAANGGAPSNGGGGGDQIAAPGRPSAAAKYGLIEPAGNGAAGPVYGLQARAPEPATPSPRAAALTLPVAATPDRDGEETEHAPPESVTATAPRAFEGGDASRASGEHSLARTERVELSATQPPRLNAGSRLVVAGLAASAATAVLSLLLRGRRGA